MSVPVPTADAPPARTSGRVPRIPRVLWVLLAGALLLRLGIASRDLDVIDRLFMPDDAYYTLSIARSIAEGNGPAADGVHLTNGFQPLIAFMMVPVFWVTSDPDAGVRAVVLLLTIIDVGVAAVLGRLAYRLAGLPGAVIAIALWAISPVAIGNAMNGLETSLAVLMSLLLVEAWWRARESGRSRDAVWAGVFAGLALLSRVDTALLVLLLGLMEIDRGSLRRLVTIASGAAVVVAPWWLYSVVEFGTFVPQSGAAVQELIAVHRAIYLDPSEQLGWGVGSVIGSPFADLPGLREFLFKRPVLAVLAWLGTFAMILWALSRMRATRVEKVPLLALLFHASALLAFYSLVVSAVWFFERYLAPVHAVVTLLVAVAGAALWRSARAGGRRRAPAVVGLVMLGALGAASVIESASYLFQTPAISRGEGLDGANGYRQAAKEVLARAPDDAVIGSLQSGALGYFAGPGVRVINLDGVVDQEAAEALKEARLAAFGRARGMTHFADWPFNVALFVARSGDPAIGPQLRPLATAGSQGGGDAFTLFALPPA